MSENVAAISAAVTAVVNAARPFTDPIFKELGDYVANRIWLKGSAVRVARRAQELAEATGEGAQSVAPKLLVSILEAASVETEDEMIEYWSRLLASASVTQRVMPSFPRILSELTAHEAQLLETLWQSEVGDRRGPFQIRLDQIRAKLDFSEPETTLMVENLSRLFLIRPTRRSSTSGMTENPPMDPNGALALTVLGAAFIEACRGPGGTRAAIEGSGSR